MFLAMCMFINKQHNAVNAAYTDQRSPTVSNQGIHGNNTLRPTDGQATLSSDSNGQAVPLNSDDIINGAFICLKSYIGSDDVLQENKSPNKDLKEKLTYEQIISVADLHIEDLKAAKLKMLEISKLLLDNLDNKVTKKLSKEKLILVRLLFELSLNIESKIIDKAIIFFEGSKNIYKKKDEEVLQKDYEIIKSLLNDIITKPKDIKESINEFVNEFSEFNIFALSLKSINLLNTFYDVRNILKTFSTKITESKLSANSIILIANFIRDSGEVILDEFDKNFVWPNIVESTVVKICVDKIFELGNVFILTADNIQDKLFEITGRAIDNPSVNKGQIKTKNTPSSKIINPNFIKKRVPTRKKTIRNRNTGRFRDNNDNQEENAGMSNTKKALIVITLTSVVGLAVFLTYHFVKKKRYRGTN